MPSLAQFITWIVMGLLGGSLAGLIITRERKGFGLARNMGLGLAGAIVGGLLFRLLGLLPGLDQISISLRDVLAAFVGSLIILAAIGYAAEDLTGPSYLDILIRIIRTSGLHRSRRAIPHLQL